MKKIVLLFSLILIYLCVNSLIVYSKENINLNLKDNEIAITFVDNNIIVTNTVNTMLMFYKTDINKISIGKITNIVNIKKLKYENIDSVNYQYDKGLISILYDDYNFCIYYEDSINTSKCNFLYLHSTSNIYNLNVNENIDVIFIKEGDTLPNYFIEDVYSKWIDIYKINNNEYVVLKINADDYRILVIPK